MMLFPCDSGPAGIDCCLGYTLKQVVYLVLYKQVVPCHIGGSLDLRALSIVSGRRCWILCIDALVLAVDGNVLVALSIAVKVLLSIFSHTVCSAPPVMNTAVTKHPTVFHCTFSTARNVSYFTPLQLILLDLCFALQAALQDTRIPLVEVGVTESPDEEPELELDDDPAHAKQIDTSQLPVIMTVSQVQYLSHLSQDFSEDLCCSE